SLIYSLVHRRRSAVPGGRCRSNDLQAVDGSRISVYEFDVAGAGLGHAAVESSLLDPSVQRRLGHTDLLSQFTDRPLIGLTCDLRLAAPIFGVDDTCFNQQVMDHRRVERVAAFGGTPALSILGFRNCFKTLARAAQIGGARDKVSIGAQRLQACDRSRQLM